MTSRLLLVEDEKALAETLFDLLTGEGFEAAVVGSLALARRRLEQDDVDLVLLDLTLPDGSGLELLDRLAAPPQGPVVVVLTADRSLATAVDAVRRGAHDYLVKPFEIEALLHRVRKALEHRRALFEATLGARLRRLEELSRPFVPPSSAPMRRLHEKLLKVAEHDDLPVLVRGETGSGKEHLCRLLHDLSPRRGEAWIVVNCATFERGLLQSELFGHERGAFTGAGERRRGLFELASRGTLMLDEVAEMPLEVQANFLRVLESGQFRRLGGSAELTTGARVIAATNVDLAAAVRQGRFRQDLYYRLNAVELEVPPLRERPEDCRALADHFCARLAASRQVDVHLTEEAHATLRRYPWPGNVRELKNVVERSAVIHGPGPITAADLDLERRAGLAPPRVDIPEEASRFPTLAEVEAAHVHRALTLAEGNRSRAARLLGVARSTLIRKLERLEQGEGHGQDETVEM